MNPNIKEVIEHLNIRPKIRAALTLQSRTLMVSGLMLAGIDALPSNASAQSRLAACYDAQLSYSTNCFGTYTRTDGEKCNCSPHSCDRPGG